jgi:hypothetical protein
MVLLVGEESLWCRRAGRGVGEGKVWAAAVGGRGGSRWDVQSGVETKRGETVRWHLQ